MPLELEYSTDNIWAMEDKEGFIGIRFDSGDAGALYVTKQQAIMLIKVLADMLAD